MCFSLPEHLPCTQVQVGKCSVGKQMNLHSSPIGISILPDSFPYIFLVSARHLGALPAQVPFRWTQAS